jgi:hypothetical protein
MTAQKRRYKLDKPPIASIEFYRSPVVSRVLYRAAVVSTEKFNVQRWAENYRHTWDLRETRNAFRILETRQETDNLSDELKLSIMVDVAEVASELDVG